MEKQTETLITLRLYEAEQKGAFCYYGSEILSISVYFTVERQKAQKHVLMTFDDYVLEMFGFDIAYNKEHIHRIAGLLSRVTAVLAERFKL